MALWLALLAALLFVFQYTTLVKFSSLPPGVSYISLAAFAQEVRQQVPLDWRDALGLGLILAVVLVVLGREVSQRRFSLFLAWAFARESRTLGLLSLSSLVCVRFYFAPGELSWAGDASYHLSYAGIAAQTIARGEFPLWTNRFGTGSPYLQFYGFFFFYLVGLVDLVCRDLYASLKLVLAGAHVASGIGTYCLVRALCRSRRAGYLAGLAYVLSFWHTQQVIIMGRLPLSVFYALLPWPFYCFERLRSSRHPRSLVATGGLALGALAFTHPGYALWATVLLGVYMALRLWPYVSGQRHWQGYSLALLAGGLLFGAYLTLPMWLERHWTGLEAGIDLSGVPDPSWQQVLGWSNYRFWLLPLPEHVHHWYGGYVGVSLAGLALAGLWRCARWRQDNRWAAPALASALCLLLTLILTFGYRWPFMRHVPVVYAFNASRYLLFSVFFLALLAGIGTKVLLCWRARNRGSPRLYVLALLAIVADLGPATFQHPYMPPGKDPLGYPASLYESFGDLARPYRDQGELPGYRIFWALGDTHPFLALGWLHAKTHTPLPHGIQAGELQAAAAFVAPLERYLSKVLGEASADQLSALLSGFPFMANALVLLNVKYLLLTRADHTLASPGNIFPNTPVLAFPRALGISSGQFSQLWSSAEVERQLQQQTQDPELLAMAPSLLPILWTIQQMRIDPASRTGERLLLLDWAGQEELGAVPQVELLEHRVWDQRVALRLRLSAPAYVRLAYGYYPYLRVRVDGQEVVPLQTVERFIALRLEAGEHRIALEPRLSPLRRFFLLLDMGLLIAAVWVWVWEGRRSERR